MNGNCYSVDGVNPTLTTNKGEGNKIAIPIERGYERIGQIPYENGRISAKTGVYSVDSGIPAQTATQGKDPYRVAIPVLTPDRAKKRQNGRRFNEDGEESFTLTAQDRHGVAIEVTGYNATLKRGGGGDGHGTGVMCERFSRAIGEQSDDDNRSNVFAIDKGIRPEEREIANCIESREDRGLSKRKQEGTLICYKISGCCGVSDQSMANKSESNTNPEN